VGYTLPHLVAAIEIEARALLRSQVAEYTVDVPARVLDRA
jgi:hypothetical protein